MSSSLRVMLVGCISIVAGLFIAAAIALIEVATDVAVYGFSAAVVIPIGAIGCGLVAAVGFYGASSVLHVRSVRAVLATPAITAISTFLASHWFVFQWYELPTGKTYAEALALAGEGFVDFLRLRITESSLTLGSSSAETTVDRLGSWGYTVVALEIVGFALGGWFVTVVLRAKPWCETCERFLKSKGAEIRRFEEPDVFEQSANHLVDVLERGGAAEAFRHAAAEKSVVSKRRNARFRTVTRLYRCGTCQTEHAVIATEHMVNNNWARLSQTPLHIEGDEVPRRPEASLIS